MKPLVLSLVSIAVFTANCQDLTDGSNNQAAAAVGLEHFSVGPVDIDFSTEVDMSFPFHIAGTGQIQNEDNIFTDEDEIVHDERSLNGTTTTASITTTSTTTNSTTETPTSAASTTKVSTTEASTTVPSTIKFPTTEASITTDSKDPKCKSDLACNLLGGFCVRSLTHCSGREVPSVCSGSKCKCCIEVELEVNLHDLETELHSMVMNLTVANSNLNTKMEAMVNFFISVNSSVHDINSNRDLKIDSLSSNLTDANSGFMNELKFIKENMTNANADYELKLDSLREHRGCPQGLFLYAPTNQCFKMLNDTSRNWYQADAACRAQGLELAQPFDPVSIRSYIIAKYGSGGSSYVWIGARGDGSYMRWLRTGKYISSSSPLWYSGHPSGKVSDHYCLMMPIYESAWKSYPDDVYYSYTCSGTYWALCERRRE